MRLFELLTDEARFLIFRRTKASIAEHQGSFLILGLVFTWLAGIGRYWDHPDAWVWQYAGLGSVIYAFVLAAILWIVLGPLRVKGSSYLSLLTFVVVTSPPALLYALPVERWWSAETAVLLNLGFLAVVALWRVILYTLFVKRVAGLRGLDAWVVILLPLAAIAFTLTLLNLEHVVFSVMAGIETETDPNQGAYALTSLLGAVSFVITPVLLILYVSTWRRCCGGVRERRYEDPPGPSPGPPLV